MDLRASAAAGQAASLAFRSTLAALLLTVFAGAELSAMPTDPSLEGNQGAISVRTAGMTSMEGFVPLHYEEESGKLFLEVRDLDTDFLYLNTLATGLGTNQPRLDRGQVGSEAVVRFVRRGSRVALVRQNVRVHARSGDEALQRSVEESFPVSVLASFPIEEEEEDALLVDATSFFLSDMFDVSGPIERAGEGSVQLDEDRSFVEPELLGAFPENTEVRSTLTFATDTPGPELRRHAPDGRSVTLQQHHSLVKLPDDPMQTRRADPRSGTSVVSTFDFSQGIEGDYREAFVARWRLEPSDPEAYLEGVQVEPVEPIVYYMDPSIPEPYRTAFIEGGRWWNEVFEAAGFLDAFRIEDLPADVDPMDARYNVIYWVHRLEPGPSVGPSFRDPRTGEILKTVIRMDSHRSLVNYNIWAGLLPAAGPEGLNLDAEEFAMARRRQHTAHEIGHTIGLPHNFIAASQGRGSVMDYPAPLIALDADGNLDLSDAYRPGPGAHDSLAIRYSYTWYPTPEEEEAGLDAMIQDGVDAGLRFITGGHASQSGSIPAATQWIEGEDMLEALERTRAVRALLIERFDENAVEPGEALSLLNQRFAHVYLHHRYALEAAVKYVGGMDFTYALRGDGQRPTGILDPDLQRTALDQVLDALEPSALDVPERIVALIPPPPFGSDGSERWIESPGGTNFDPVALAWSLAAEVADNLLHRERAARLVSFHARDPRSPSLAEVMERMEQATWGRGAEGERETALLRVTQRAVLDAFLDLAGDVEATAEVRAVAQHRLADLDRRIAGESGGSPESEAHRAQAARDIERFFRGEDDPATRSRPQRIPLPWP